MISYELELKSNPKTPNTTFMVDGKFFVWFKNKIRKHIGESFYKGWFKRFWAFDNFMKAMQNYYWI